jgi:hypothetical protein
MNSRILIFALMCLASGTTREAGALESVPFVGCSGDGQMGPIAAKTGEPMQVHLNLADANRLAFYNNGWSGGVLAPRDWHCFVLYGSNGVFLAVAPDLDPSKGFEAIRKADLFGPAVVLDVWSGGASGRFAVATYAARLFPREAHDYIERIARMEDAVDHGDFRHSLRFKPYPADILKRKSRFQVEFETPPRREGLGTSGFPRIYAVSSDPIYGVVTLSGKREWPDLLLLAVRLPRELRSLRSAIIEDIAARKW